jgi:hypothetical protein
MTPPYLTDEEIANICRPLKRNTARIRYLRETLKLRVDARPDGSPLVRRADWERHDEATGDAKPAGRGPRWSIPA